MAQGDSLGRNLDKRTRELSRDKVRPGTGLSAQQMAQNQLQAIQNEQRNNLAQQRVQAQVSEQVQQVAVQAAQIGSTMEPGPAAETLKRYGLTKPRTIRTQSHDIKVAPPNITINNTTTTTNTTAGGPTPGRELAFRQPQQSTNKFKMWLSGLLLSQKEENAKREREFDRRESVLVRGSNKMLKRIEEAGRDIATNLNPKVIGTTVGNQFRMLLMLFVFGFLAKHWEKVLNGIDTVIGFFRKSLDYFGITEHSDRPRFYKDLVTFFGGNGEKDTLMDVFKEIGKEMIDYLKMKLDHAMSLRGDAIKNIKFPEVDTGDIFKTLSNIAGYVGNILTAMMDPKKGVADSIKREVNSSMSAIQRDSAKEAHSFDDEIKGVKGLKDTSYGAYAAEVRQALTQNALTSDGSLKNNTWASLSQGRDLVQAFNNSKSGVIDIARMGGGLQRLQDTASRTGYVTLDADSVNALFGDKVHALIQSGKIKQVPMKYIQRKKTDQDYADENASVETAAIKGALEGKILNSIGVTDAAIGGRAISGGAVGAVAGSFIPGVGTTVGGVAGTVVGAAKGWLTSSAGGRAISKGIAAAGRKLVSDENTLDLVPLDVPGDPVEIGGRTIRQVYQVSPDALNQLASILTNNSEITKIDSGSERFMRALEQRLKSNAGGRIKSIDYDLDKGYQAVRNIEEKEAFYEREENNHIFSQRMDTIANNGKRLANSAYQGMGSVISTVGNYITDFARGSGSNKIRSWLYGGGNVPTTAYEGSDDEARMNRQMVRVSFPIRDLNGRETTHSISIHKYLAEDVRSIFTEIFESTTFKIDPDTTGGYNYRNIHHKKNSGNISPHAFGYAVDINWKINPCPDDSTVNTDVHLGTKAHPVVQIFYSHRWQWGGEWKKKDNMHFEYAGNPGNVGKSTVGAQIEYMSQEQSDAANAGYVSQPISVEESGRISYVAQGSYVNAQTAVIPPTGNHAWKNVSDMAGANSHGKWNNNPGNRIGEDKIFGSGLGTKNSAGRFTKYDNLENGYAGCGYLLMEYLTGKKGPRKKNPTVREIVKSWTGNETNVKKIAELSGLGTDTPIATTYDNLADLNYAVCRMDSGIVSKKDLIKGSSKAWTVYIERNGDRGIDSLAQPANGDNEMLSSLGERMSELGDDMQDGQLFDNVPTPEEEAIINKRKDNENILMSNFSPTDQGYVLKGGYFKTIYGSSATLDSILGEWDKDPSKMDRDIKYHSLYEEALKLWSTFGGTGLQKTVLGTSDYKDFVKKYLGLSNQDRNLIKRMVNKYNQRHKLRKSYKDFNYGDRNIMDVMDGASEEQKNTYTWLMSIGEYEKAHNLITSHVDSRYAAGLKNSKGVYNHHLQKKKEEELARMEEQFKEGRAVSIHGEDYKYIQKELNAARAELKEAEKQKKNASDFHLFRRQSQREKDIKEADERLSAAQERFNSLKAQSDAYTSVDDRVKSLSDHDAKSISEFDKKTKRSLEIRERLAQMQKDRGGRSWDTFEEANAYIKEWDKEKAALDKELEENEKSIKKLIGDDQNQLFSDYKKKVSDYYTKMGKNVAEAEEEYAKLAESGKTHQEIMAELNNKYDSEMISYLQNFGDTIVEEKKNIEEKVNQQLRETASKLAGININSIDWSDEYFKGANDENELAKRAKIKSITDQGLPIKYGDINEKDLPKGYAWDDKEGYYLPTDQSKRSIKRTRVEEVKSGVVYKDSNGKRLNLKPGTMVRLVEKDYLAKMATAAATSKSSLNTLNSMLESHRLVNRTADDIRATLTSAAPAIGKTADTLETLIQGLSNAKFVIYTSPFESTLGGVPAFTFK